MAYTIQKYISNRLNYALSIFFRFEEILCTIKKLNKHFTHSCYVLYGLFGVYGGVFVGLIN